MRPTHRIVLCLQEILQCTAVVKKDKILLPSGYIETKLCTETVEDGEYIQGSSLRHSIEDEDVPQSHNHPPSRGDVHMEGKADILASKTVDFLEHWGSQA